MSHKYPIGEPRAKMSSSLLPFLGQPLSAPLQARLARMAVRTAAVDRIPVRLDVDVTAANSAGISATGATIVREIARWNTITVEATPAQVDALAALPYVRQVGMLQPPRHSNEGVPVMHTDALRSAHIGLDGSGRSIGIISDTVNHTGAVGSGVIAGSVPNAIVTLTTPQNAGKLPASFQVVDFGPTTSSDTDEGEAMLEEVYGAAPGAPLAFAAADTDDSIMATNIGLLQNSAGCTVIADDVAFLNEPFFQDGPIAQAIDAFRLAGGLYFSAAGNNNHSGIMQSYVAIGGPPEVYDGTTGLPTIGSNFHNWGLGGSTPGFLPIIIPAGVSIDFVLEWNQPYQSYGLGAGSQQDFDIYLYDAPSVPGTISGTVITGQNSAQGNTGLPSGDPVESFQYANATGSTQTLYLAVDKFHGLPSAVLRILVAGDGAYTPPVGSTVFGGPTSFGHCTARGALAIAAAPSNAPGTVEPFSSKGGWGSAGIPFYFDTSGNPLPNAPQLRNKPDLTAPDLITCSTPRFAHFQGTSAAAPNAAACAELVWLVCSGDTNEQIIRRLEGTAGAVSSPSGAEPNEYTGFGMVNGLLAASATVITSISSPNAAGTYAGGMIPIVVHFSNPVTVTGTPSLELNTTPVESALYASGSTTSTLIFNYQIVAGDSTAKLDLSSSSALQLNGGVITDSLPQAAASIVPTATTAGSLPSSVSLAIAATAPTLAITSPATAVNPAITFTCTFSQPVTGFSAANLDVSNATKGTFTTISASVYTLAVTATASGAVTASALTGAGLNAFSFPSTAATASCVFTAAVGITSTGTGAAATSGTTTAGTTSATTSSAGPTTSIAPTTTGATASATGTPPPSSGGGGGGGCGLGGLTGIILMVACTRWRRGRPHGLSRPSPG